MGISQTGSDNGDAYDSEGQWGCVRRGVTVGKCTTGSNSRDTYDGE